jgi:hypothetical protein
VATEIDDTSPKRPKGQTDDAASAQDNVEDSVTHPPETKAPAGNNADAQIQAHRQAHQQKLKKMILLLRYLSSRLRSIEISLSKP